MGRITEYLKTKGLKTAKIPLLDTPVYYGATDDYDIFPLFFRDEE